MLPALQPHCLSQLPSGLRECAGAVCPVPLPLPDLRGHYHPVHFLLPKQLHAHPVPGRLHPGLRLFCLLELGPADLHGLSLHLPPMRIFKHHPMHPMPACLLPHRLCSGSLHLLSLHLQNLPGQPVLPVLFPHSGALSKRVRALLSYQLPARPTAMAPTPRVRALPLQLPVVLGTAFQLHCLSQF